MRPLFSMMTLVPVAGLLAATPALAQDPAITAFETARQEAWNAHDAAAYAAGFDDAADVVTAQGWHWAGRAEAARNLADGFRLVYARAHMTLTDVTVRALAPDAAAVTLRWTITGARAIDGGLSAGPQQGFETQILQRRGAGWAIVSQQDTLAPEAPVTAPTSPAVAPQAPAQAYPTTPPPVRRCIMARKNGDCILWGKAKPVS